MCLVSLSGILAIGVPKSFGWPRACIPGQHMSSNTARENIHTIAELERDFENQRTRSEALADAVADFVGSIPFVGMHLAAIAGWVVINLGAVPGLRPFDPFPFILLALIVSCEGVILATFVPDEPRRGPAGSPELTN